MWERIRKTLRPSKPLNALLRCPEGLLEIECTPRMVERKRGNVPGLSFEVIVLYEQHEVQLTFICMHVLTLRFSRNMSQWLKLTFFSFFVSSSCWSKTIRHIASTWSSALFISVETRHWLCSKSDLQIRHPRKSATCYDARQIHNNYITWPSWMKIS